jgi:hypothetical protein
MRKLKQFRLQSPNPVKLGSLYTSHMSSRNEADKIFQGKDLLRGGRNP